MLNTPCRKTGQDTTVSVGGSTVAMIAAPSAATLQESEKALDLQTCWIRLWDRWACEQRNVVLYQMHINHALSRERSKLTLAGGRVVSCSRRIKQQQQQRGGGISHHQLQQHQQQLHQQSRCDALPAHPTPSPSSHLSRSSSVSSTWSTATTVAVDDDLDLDVVPIPSELPDAAGARDLRVLSAAMDRLRASGWYYEGPDAQAHTAQALAAMPPGRFCVRDSGHSEHLFTMDVQTGYRGRLMSVRFTYADGAFGLDSAPRLAGALRVPGFRCPIELIDYYVRLSRISAARQMLAAHPVWVDQRGQFFSWVNLRQPMVKADPVGFPSLKHKARLVINRHKRLITITPTSLPNELIEYLLQYPYSL